MSKALCVALAATILTGCAPPLIRGTFLDQMPTKRALITPIGQPITKEIGETIYEKGYRVTKVGKTATTQAAVTSSLDLGHKLNVPAGATGPLFTRSENGQPAMCFATSGIGQVVTSTSSFGGGQTIACLMDVDNNGSFDKSMFNTREKYFDLSNAVPYSTKTTSEIEVEEQGSFRVDFIYQGLAKGVLKFSYREFSGGIARPAFTQDLTYDIAPDGTASIGFKGMRIKVLKATNESITYVVEKEMNT